MTKTIVAVVIAALCVTFSTGGAQAQAAPTLQIIAGDKQDVGPDRSGQNAYFAPMILALDDANGNPISGASITVSCDASSPLVCRMDPDGRTSVNVTTDTSGYAVVARWFKGQNASFVAYGGLGPVTVTAAYRQVRLKRTFTVGTSYVVNVIGGDGQHGVKTSGMLDLWFFPYPLSVIVTDRSGRVVDVDGASVTFTCTPPPSAQGARASSCMVGMDFTPSSTVPLSHGAAQSWLIPPNMPPGAQLPPAMGFATCNYPGTYTITATYQGASATFTEYADAPHTTKARGLPQDMSACIDSRKSRP